MKTLHIQLPSGSSHFYRLTEDDTVIGRSHETDIQVSARGVSRRHCAIRRRNGAFFIEDLKSKNGVYLNDEPVKKARLENNDVIILGEARMLFYDPSSVSALPGAKIESGLDQSSPLKWVQANSEILYEGPEKDPSREGERRSPGKASIGASDAMRLERREIALQRRLDQLNFRNRVYRSLAFLVSVPQLYESVADLLFGEFPFRSIVVLEDRDGDIIPAFHRSFSDKAGSEDGEQDEVFFSLSAIDHIRRSMRPMSVSWDELSDVEAPTETEKGRRSQAFLAPLFAHGEWFGVLQAECGKEPIADDEEFVELFAELADVLSQGLGELKPELRESASEEALKKLASKPTGLMSSVPSEEIYQEEDAVVVVVRFSMANNAPDAGDEPPPLSAVNAAFAFASNLLEENGATIVGAIGSTLVAAFRDEAGEGRMVEQAAETSVAVLLSHIEWNQERRQRGRVLFESSVAISFGSCQIGKADDETFGVDVRSTMIGAPLDEALKVSAVLGDGRIVISPNAFSKIESGLVLAGEISHCAPDDQIAALDLSSYYELSWKGNSSA